ncbi:MAG: hypothetical protein ACJATE_002013 [Bacteroidia bacterium]|jgi:hypothetical protein
MEIRLFLTHTPLSPRSPELLAPTYNFLRVLNIVASYVKEELTKYLASVKVIRQLIFLSTLFQLTQQFVPFF